MPPSTKQDIEETKKSIEDITQRLRNAETRIDAHEARFLGVEGTVSYHNKLLVIGNGDPPLKELGREVRTWLNENKDLPETVRTYGRWIQNVNRIGWGIIMLLITLVITDVYSVFFKHP